MLGKTKALTAGVTGVAMTLLATPAFARSVDLKGAGVALWVFLIIGAIVILLQLIPAAILFLSFIGTASKGALKKETKVEEEVPLPETEPLAVR